MTITSERKLRRKEKEAKKALARKLGLEGIYSEAALEARMEYLAKKGKLPASPKRYKQGKKQPKRSNQQEPAPDLFDAGRIVSGGAYGLGKNRKH